MSIIRKNEREGEREKDWSFLCGKGEFLRELNHSITVLTGWLQRGQSLSLHKEPHGADKGQWVEIALVKISS